MMNIPRLCRTFVPRDFKITTWEALKPFFDNLLGRDIETITNLRKWLEDYSELSAIVSEDFGWRYIRMNGKTDDEALKGHFEDFVQNIQPHLQTIEDQLDRKLLATPSLHQLDATYDLYLKAKRQNVEIFRKENVPLLTQLESLQQQFGTIASQQMIAYEGQSMTMNQAGKYLENPDRSKRKEVYTLIGERRLKDQQALDKVMDELLDLRHRVATNADFTNFRDYQFAALNRFDYGPADCEAFHQSIAKKVVPLNTARLKTRKAQMGFDTLKPYDLSVDPLQRPPLTPFDKDDEFLEKSIDCLHRIDPLLGKLLKTMGTEGYLDLTSRKGKAPGGFNYSLNESGIPFIYMNASGRHQDIETIVHEAGHALHALIDAQHIDFTPMRSTPAEVAEVASMSLELISMDTWDVFYPDPEDLRRAKIEKLEDLLATLPAVAKVDAFQHWMYLHPDHTPTQRSDKWLELEQIYSSGIVDQSGYEAFRRTTWQRILHIFEVPFYYVEYGFAQLGAIALWKQYLEDPEKALTAYKKFMEYGHTRSIPELYQLAGIQFDFSPDYIGTLMDFVKTKLAELEG